MRARTEVCGVTYRPHERRMLTASRGDVSGLLDRRVLERHEARNAFLQQQRGCLDARIGMEPPLHRRRVQRIVRARRRIIPW